MVSIKQLIYQLITKGQSTAGAKNKFDLLIVEVIVTVDDGEHFLVELVEELVHHVVEVDFSSQEVPFELHEQFTEHVRVLFVNDSVSLLEHLVESVSRLRKQRFEEFWN